MHSNGSMAADTWIGSYYVNASGAWVPGKVKYTAGWIQNGSRWWYRHQDDSYTTNGWEYINGQWYYFDQSGWMVTGWLKLGNTDSCTDCRIGSCLCRYDEPESAGAWLCQYTLCKCQRNAG